MSAKERERNEINLNFAAGIAIGVPIGLIVTRWFWPKERAPKPFKPPIPPYQESQDNIKDRPGADNGPAEAHKVPEGG